MRAALTEAQRMRFDRLVEDLERRAAP
jgi:hypothetical protein